MATSFILSLADWPSDIWIGHVIYVSRPHAGRDRKGKPNPQKTISKLGLMMPHDDPGAASAGAAGQQ